MRRRTSSTSHEAFGYLADAYGLTQVGIAGLSPDSEPSPATLADVAEFVDAHDVTTIYYEALVDPSIAETVAAETGAGTAVLDPLEGLSDESAGDDYFAVMRSNLATLRTGQGCRERSSAAPAIPTAAIRVREAWFGYGNHEAARADIEIDAGDVVAVLGPNGSGKSTLIKGMLGLVDVLGGASNGSAARCRWPIDRRSATCRSVRAQPDRSR